MKTYERYAEGDAGKNGRSAREIESDVEHIRAEMIHTIEAIEAKLSPGELINQVIHQIKSVREGSSGLGEQLGAMLKSNPVSLLLFAGGVMSLLFSRSETASRTLERAKERALDMAAEGADRAREVAREMAHEGVERARGVAHEGVERVREVAHEGVQRAREATGEGIGMLREHAPHLEGGGQHGAEAFGAASEQARGLARSAQSQVQARARSARAQTRSLFQEQPLVWAGLGLAFGAMVAGPSHRQ